MPQRPATASHRARIYAASVFETDLLHRLAFPLALRKRAQRCQRWAFDSTRAARMERPAQSASNRLGEDA
jgi:hypothetical protein